MTLDERIAAATAEAKHRDCLDPDGEAILRAAVPELFNGKGWIAPSALTPGMCEDWWQADRRNDYDRLRFNYLRGKGT